MDWANMGFDQTSLYLKTYRQLLLKGGEVCINDEYKLVLKKILGESIREIGAGEIFGEKALDGETLRSASVITVSDCKFMSLGKQEYNSFIKTAVRQKRNEKFSLLHQIFEGSEELDFETFWQFQYLFNVRKN